MAKVRSDKLTLDLFEWKAPELTSRFEDHRVRSASLKSKIAKAVKETLTDSDLEREQIADQMSRWLDEEVTKHMLDAYASEAREKHTITFLRALALIHVTGDLRLLQMGSEMFGASVIDDHFLPWVEVGQLADKKNEIESRFEVAKRMARKGARK